MYTQDFIYLVQGQRERVEGYVHLADRPRADALFMTYDEPLDGAVFFPNSTWGEGRNRLLEMARSKGSYHYTIFCDDDIAFDTGDWEAFEDHLLAQTPAIGVPVVPRTRHTTIPLQSQPFGINDEQLMGIHQDVIDDGLLFPYQTQFDSIHWWAACHIQQILIQTLYRDAAVQFNGIQIQNECARRYDNPEGGRASFKPLIREWLGDQFVDGYRDFEYHTGKFHWRAWRRVLLKELRTLGRSRAIRHTLPPENVTRMFTPDAELLVQYQNRTRPERFSEERTNPPLVLDRVAT